VTRLFDRLGAAFVAPPPGATSADRSAAARRADAREAAAPASVAVLCPPRDALVVGAAAALTLASRIRTAHALLAVWGAEGPVVRAPASGAARRAAATLASRGHAATASGRLVVVRLAGDLAQAAPEAVRAQAAVPSAPGVVVLAGPRDDAADGLLRAQDRVLVASRAGGEREVAELALAGLSLLGAPAAIAAIPALAPPVRTLAASGTAVVAPLRSAIHAALDATPGEGG
jgi:hypothetical protein